MGLEINHVLLVSFNSQGHVNPFFRLAKRLASKGLHVTFSSTYDVGQKIKASAKHPSAATTDASAFTPIGKGCLRFEYFHDGIDVHDDSKRKDLTFYMTRLKEVGTLELTKLIKRQAENGRPVNYIIGNPFIPWVVDVGVEMGIPCGVLWVQSCAVFSTYHCYHHKLAEFPSFEKPDVSVTVPGVPTLSADEIPSFLLPGNPYPSITDAILSQFHNLGKASWVLVNSFDELEGETVKAVAPLVKLIPVGPLVDLPEADEDFISTQQQSEKFRSDLFEQVVDCIVWLETKEPNSVVYVSMGSVVPMSKEDVVEMAWGLKDCNKNFLWVVRDDARSHLPQGFEDETRDRGLVVNWCPQDRVLVHLSVACFLTHCGWNSTLECLTSGVPVITFPHWGDQTTDAKFLVEVYGVGVHLRQKKNPYFGRNDLVRAVEEVTEGPRAEEFRNNALKWKLAGRAAITVGGSSNSKILEIVDKIRAENFYSSSTFDSCSTRKKFDRI